jgi:hypothetical protein
MLKNVYFMMKLKGGTSYSSMYNFNIVNISQRCNQGCNDAIKRSSKTQM